jgi:hypothetical protein
MVDRRGGLLFVTGAELKLVRDGIDLVRVPRDGDGIAPGVRDGREVDRG